MSWSYGITAVPSRVYDLLPRTLESLAKAGFNEPTVFMDGQVIDMEALYFVHNGPLVIHRPRIGHFANWINSLYYLYTTNPKAKFFALFEDDLLAVSNLRTYIEQCYQPTRGYFNLVTHDQNYIPIKRKPGWHQPKYKGKGALGLVLSSDVVQVLIRSTNLESYLRSDKRKAADGYVMTTLTVMRYKEYVHSPGLLQHTGLISTLDHKYGYMNSFPGEDYNPLELLKGGEKNE
jgi:hypothetical protein